MYLPFSSQPSRFRALHRAAVLSLTAGALAVVAIVVPSAGTGQVTDAANLRHSRIPLSTGVELHVAETGPEGGTPVVFLHGVTDSWFSWSLVLEHLPDDVRAIVPTQRGHGDSDKPACCYQVADLAADVVALLDALDIERAGIVGHSMGGLVAQRVAITAPERVSRLVIVSSAASVRNDVVVEFNDVVQQLADPVDPAFVREFQSGTAVLPLRDEFLDRVVTESLQLPARVWRALFAGMMAPEGANEAGRIRAPTLIVWGAQDAFFGRATQDHLVRSIPDARLVVFEEAAHAPNWELPARLAAEIARFVR